MNLTKFEEKVVPVADKISSNRYLKAISNGFMMTMPAVIGGALFVLIRSLPLGSWYTNFLASSGLDVILGYPVVITTNMMSLFVLLAISYGLAKSFEKNGFSAMMVALIAFLLVIPMDKQVESAEGMLAVENVLPLDWMGAQGIFTAILVAIISTRLFVFFVEKNFTIKLPKSVPPTVSDAFTGLFPSLIITGLFLAIKVLFQNTTFGSLNTFIYQMIQTPLQALGTSFPALLIAVIVMNILWLLGIHGSLVIFSVFGPFWTTAGVENLNAFQNGNPIPNIVSTTFFQTFGSALGGVGATLGMCIILAFVCKSQRLKMVGRLALPASLFNVSEPLLYGLPIVMNIYLAIPFILSNVICVTIPYVLMKINFMTPLPELGIPYTIPVGFNGFLSGGDLSNGIKFAVVQLVSLALCTVLYYPFIRIMDKEALKQERAENLEIENVEKASTKTVIS